MKLNRLDNLLAVATQQRPHHIAVIDPANGEMTYTELHEVTQQISQALQSVGVGGNDRVGICVPKSIGTVASIFASLACGACYVPVDSGAPPQRSAFIFNDCAVKAILVHRPLLENLQAGLGEYGVSFKQSFSVSTPGSAGVDLVLLVPDSVQSAAFGTDCAIKSNSKPW